MTKGLKMNNKLTGSDLTRAMLARGDEQVWCAVDDESDDIAVTDHESNDFTAHIASYQDGKFFSTSGMPWLCAVPVKIVALTQEEVGL